MHFQCHSRVVLFSLKNVMFSRVKIDNFKHRSMSVRYDTINAVQKVNFALNDCRTDIVIQY